MAEQSLISAVAANRPARIDPNEFKPKSGGELNVVSEPFRPSSKEKQESSLRAPLKTHIPVFYSPLKKGDTGGCYHKNRVIRGALK